MPATPANIFVFVVEALLLLSGVVLLVRHGSRRIDPATGTQASDALTPWQIPLSDFLLFALVIIAGGFVGTVASGLLLSLTTLPPDTKTILNSAAFQIGLLIGPALVPLQLGHQALRPPLTRSTLLSGAATFVIALPIVTLMNLFWLWCLKTCGLPAEQQDLLRMFSQADSTPLLGLMIILATMIAPMTEELLFRATLFRYLRTRLPRALALLIPGIIFAALHVDWKTLDGLASFLPLITLAVVFSIAFERTGKIGTPIVAHGLFNLHTILILFSGAIQ